MSKLKTTHKKKLNVVYVFTKNNQVYVKKDPFSELDTNIHTINNEWYPINFQWKSLK